MAEVHHADRVIEQANNRDHDLLIAIDTKLERALIDIKDLKDGTAAKITDLENTRATTTDVASLRSRIAWLERIAYIGMGILYAAEAWLRLKH